MNDVYELTLDGPGKNALGTAMIESILARLDDAVERAILLVGAGDTFSAGLNLKEVASLDAAGMRRFVELVERLMDRLFLHPAPIVACLNGHAIAGGCVIGLCCDHRVATDDARARIGLNEVALGLVFPPKIARIVKHRVPPRSIHEVVLRGALYSPAEALRVGLVDEVSADALAVARERARELAALPPAGYVSAKRMLRHGLTALDDDTYARELEATLPAWTSDDIKQRIRARLGR